VSALRILIADDESLIRMGLRKMLEQAGHQVIGAAPDGRTAVRLAHDLDPELAILDIKMPGYDGLEAARRIVAERPIPVIILTAYGQRDLVEEASRAPVMAYLVKPVKEAELMATLEIVATRFAERLRMVEETVNLRETLENRKVIERAKGLLMAREGLSEKDAHRYIQTEARRQRRTMRDVAEEVLRENG
jgi:AmiR/NasT family two-component response regulator